MQSNLARKHSSFNPLRFKSTFVLAFVFFYFAYHLVTGERGLLAYIKLKNQMENTKKQSAIIQHEKLGLSKKVNGLRDDSLNLDLVEELARKDLGYSKKDEVVLFEGEEKDQK